MAFSRVWLWLAMIVGLGIAGVLTAIDAGTTRAEAGACRKDSREIRLSKGSVQLSEYSCRSDRDSETELRVQFQRLSGLAPGVLLNGGSAPWKDELYGKHRVIGNDVLKEYKDLLAKFGSAVRRKAGGDHVIYFKVGTPENSSDDQVADSGAEVHSFVLSEFPDIPLVDEMLEILGKRTWPASVRMHYTFPLGDGFEDPRRKSPMSEMTVWRYLTPSDARDYSHRLKRFNALVADRIDVRPEDTKALEFLRYVTAQGWPEKFLSIYTLVIDDDGCSVLDFKIDQYSFAVDIAVVENTSSKPININQLLGRSGGSSRLRDVRRAAARGAASSLPAGAITLEPSERLIVPLALVFIGPEEVAEDARDLSRKRYRRIANSRAGTVFETKIVSSPLRGVQHKSEEFRLRKLRESFKAPTYPEITDYAFGPEWWLTGFTVGDERTVFEEVDPNFLEITYAHEIGSCPILYAWSGPDAIWYRHGKIIHKAQSKINAQSETVTFDGFVHRFRIVEEELERATIAGMKLTVELTDGSTFTLAPDSVLLADGAGVQLYANEKIEINFTLPIELKDNEVVRSHLTVTGYYDRYSALLLSRQ